ncbi:MAG: protein kinase [Bryobacteraceae bacterium]|nr:protein kinase [Bryobacteraceae bacterium]
MATKPAIDFQGSQRFRVIRRLGAGGMGVVYEVHDNLRDARLALKTLQVLNPEGLHRFKSEFRVLAGITHPNLVSLYELIGSGSDWFFTMELVEGQDFLSYVARPRPDESAEAWRDTPTLSSNRLPESGPADPLLDSQPTDIRPALARLHAPRCDIAKLRDAFSQLVSGIRAIHAAGKLHRDLKPSNVMVTPSGRVVILDFGLAIDLEHRHRAAVEAPGGTPRYMAPEQAAAGPLSEASDWYAAGVMLFEALIGWSPAHGTTPQEILRHKLYRPAGRPSDYCEGVPEDLNLLCGEMLKSDPERRPGGEEIALRLDARRGGRRSGGSTSATAALVGREAPLAAMREAFAYAAEHGAAAVYIQGKSGMGKSALLDRFLRECALLSEVVALSGRCYEQESVPFKALDALMDSLGTYLRRLSPAEIGELLPRNVNVLAQMFPTLLRVPAIASAPRGRAATKDAIEYRQVASTALREMMGRIADRRRLVIAIDDLHWGDLDSSTLIAELLSPPDPPPLLLLAAWRGEEGESNPGLAPLRKDNPAVRRFVVTLEALSAQDVVAVARGLGGGPGAIPLERARKIAEDSGGNPYFIHEFLTSESDWSEGLASVDDLLWSRATRLDAASRRLLEVVSVSGRPIELRLAFQAAQLQEDSYPIYAALRNARLVRRAGVTEPEQVETYHDRIRETVAQRLRPDELRGHHHHLAAALRSMPGADPEQLAFHLEGAGDTADAADYYAQAAHRAAGALAFDHAALLYRRSLALSGADGDRRRELLTKLAEALANSGRSHDAACHYKDAADLAAGATRRDLEQRAAYYYCISGHLDEGKDALREVLRQFGIGMPSSSGRAVASYLAARTRLWVRGMKYREQTPERLPPRVRERLDAVWAAAVGLGNADVVSGLGFSTRGVALSLDAGDPARIARALLWEASLSAVDDVKRARKLIDVAERVMKRCGNLYLTGMLYLARAIYTMNLIRWRDAMALFDQAEQCWREHPAGVDWELATTRHFSFWALAHSGEFSELGKRARAARREAEDRGNLYMIANIGSWSEPLALLAEDRPEQANQVREQAMAQWTRKYYLVQHNVATLSEIECLLYVGQGEAAQRACQKQAADSRAHGLHRLDMNRVYNLGLSLNSAVVRLSEPGDGEPRIREAESILRRLDKESLPWAPAMAAGGRAAIALNRGERAGAMRFLETCIAKYNELGMYGCSSTARRHLGRIAGGEGGQQLFDEGDRWLSEHGVAEADRFSGRCLPMPFPDATIGAPNPR